MYLDYLGALNAVASILTRGIQGNPDRREQGLVKAEAETEATWPNDQDAVVGGAYQEREGAGRTLLGSLWKEQPCQCLDSKQPEAGFGLSS